MRSRAFCHLGGFFNTLGGVILRQCLLPMRASTRAHIAIALHAPIWLTPGTAYMLGQNAAGHACCVCTYACMLHVFGPLVW